MATLKQIEANRLNAQDSTGPRTPEGKSAVRFNALKPGVYAESPIITDEGATAFVVLRDSYLLRFQLAAPKSSRLESNTLVSNLVRYAGLLDRPTSVPIKELDYLQRHLNATWRNYRCDLELLLKLQAARKKAAPSPEPILEPQSAELVPPKIGFVPANSFEAASRLPPLDGAA